MYFSVQIMFADKFSCSYDLAVGQVAEIENAVQYTSGLNEWPWWGDFGQQLRRLVLLDFRDMIHFCDLCGEPIIVAALLPEPGPAELTVNSVTLYCCRLLLHWTSALDRHPFW